MLIILARVFAVIFTLLVIVKSYLGYRAKQESLTMAVFWSLTWLIITAISFFPAVVNRLIGSPNASGGVGTILGIGLIFIYFVIYRIYIKADRIEKQLRHFVRELALKDEDEPTSIEK